MEHSMKLKMILLFFSLFILTIQHVYAAAAADLSDYRELLDKESSGDAKKPVLASKDLVKITLSQAEDNYQESLKLITSNGFNYSFEQTKGTRVFKPSHHTRRYDDENLSSIGGLVDGLLSYLRPAFEAGHFKAANLLEIVLADRYSYMSSPSRKVRNKLIERDFVMRFIYNHPSAAATLRSLMLTKIERNAKSIAQETREIRNDGCGVHVGLCFFNTICGCGYCRWLVDDLCTDCLGRCCGAYV